MKKKLGLFLAMIVAVASFAAPVTASAAVDSVTFSDVSIVAKIKYVDRVLPLTVSDGGKTFTVTEIFGEDFDKRGNPGTGNYDRDFNINYSWETVTGELHSAGSKYHWAFESPHDHSLSMYEKKPYDTDPYYIIWQKTLYDHATATDDGTGTTFTVKVPKWESLYKPEIVYDRWSRIFVDGTERKVEDFKKVPGLTNTFEYVLLGGYVTNAPYKVNISQLVVGDFYLDGAKVSNSSVNTWTKEFTLTAAKPYVDFKYIPTPGSNTKYKTYEAATWRIRANIVAPPGSGYDNKKPVVTKGTFTTTSGSKVDVSVAAIPNKTWTGSQIKPAPVVTAAGKKLAKGTDYTVTYKSNKNIGKAALTITGKGKYKGSITANYYIIPKAPSKPALTAAKKALKIKWTKPTKFSAQKLTGYQVQYRVKGTSKWTVKTYKVSYKQKAKTVTKTIKKLRAKKNYQVQVRSYKSVSGVKYYSAWTKVKTIKTK